MSRRDQMRTEHAGAKNGGGFWGKRAQAKDESRRVRRGRDKREVVLGLRETQA